MVALLYDRVLDSIRLNYRPIKKNHG